MNSNDKYTWDDIQETAARQRRDRLSGIYRYEAEHPDDCTCGWQSVLSTREFGWSGTWCYVCAVADEMQQGNKRRFQLRKANDEIEELRSLITAWADACILMEKTGSLDTTTPEGIAAGQALIALRKAVGR
jgi:hypothetical protein